MTTCVAHVLIPTDSCYNTKQQENVSLLSTMINNSERMVKINRITLSLVSVACLYKVCFFCGHVLVTLLSATACYNLYLPYLP